MSLKLSKTNTPPYDYFSSGTKQNPISTQVILTGTGGVKPSDVITVYLVATQFNYTNIVITSINEQSGINSRISLDNNNWQNSVTVSDMDATQTDQILPIYIVTVVNNDNSVPTGNYDQIKIRISAVENP